MSIAGPAKMAVDAAATAAGKLDAFAKSAEKALADGKQLTFFEDAIQGIKLFGQANIALQCLSMGLTAIGVLMGDKSQEAQILDGIDKVLGRIDTLESDVNTRFDELATQLNIQTGKVELQPYLVAIEAAEDYLSQINARKAKGQDFHTLEDELVKFNTPDFVKAMVQIFDSCAGTPTSPNILKDVYDFSYGDIRKVWPVGEYLLQKAASALMLHGIVASLQSKRANTAFDASQIAGLYDVKMKAVAAAFEKCASDCISRGEMAKNIKRYLDAKKFAPLALTTDDKQGSSSRIASSLQDLYPYLNFSVIVYDPVSGYDHHAVAGSGECFMAEFRYPDVAGKPVNLIIYWANNAANNRQAVITYQSAVVDWHVFPGPRKDRSFDTSTFKSWPNRPPGARYQFVYDLAGKANLSTNNSPFLGDWGHKNKDLSTFLNNFNSEPDTAKREPNSMIWFFFADNYQDAKQTDIGMTSYNAMYGLVAPYTTICFWEH